MNPITSYDVIDTAWPYQLRGVSGQTTDVNIGGLLTPTGTAPTAIRTEGIAVSSYRLHNRSGGAAFVGLGVRIPNRYWIAGQWDDDAGTPFTADTVDAQDRDTADFALETTTINDGYVVASQVPFNAIGIDVTTASIGAAVERTWRHTNEAGGAWVASTTDETVISTAVGAAAGTNYAAGANVIVVTPMMDWGKTQAAGLSGIPGGYYAINVRATVAPTTAGVARSIEIYRIYGITEAVADNSVTIRDFSPSELQMPYGDMLVAFFSVANLGNHVTVLARPRG